jgi:UPF0716 protein FxsA
MWLFLAFLLVPIIEIALFIQVGGLIGLWPTLGIVVLTAVAGTALVRSQGFRVLADLRNSFERLSDPTEPLVNGAMILFAGALLLTPGFFTDSLGLLLLIPGVRSKVYRWIRARVVVESVAFGPSPGTRRPRDPDVIDAEYHEVKPTHRPDGPSGWTRH